MYSSRSDPRRRWCASAARRAWSGNVTKAASIRCCVFLVAAPPIHSIVANPGAPRFGTVGALGKFGVPSTTGGGLPGPPPAPMVNFSVCPGVTSTTCSKVSPSMAARGASTSDAGVIIASRSFHVTSGALKYRNRLTKPWLL